jgi:hypothetical protein
MRYKPDLDQSKSNDLKKGPKPVFSEYSSGESPKESEFETALKELSPSDRKTRLLWHW